MPPQLRTQNVRPLQSAGTSLSVTHRCTLAASLLLAATAAQTTTATCVEAPADGPSASARFIEGAPTDRLELRNTSAGGWQISRFVWQLAPSRGRLIFDVTSAGAGVQVFQPLRVVSVGANAPKLVEVPQVRDGDESLSIRFQRFTGQQVFAATMDLDDRLGAREITVSGSEIAGAVLRIDFTRSPAERQTLNLVFNDQALACHG